MKVNKCILRCLYPRRHTCQLCFIDIAVLAYYINALLGGDN